MASIGTAVRQIGRSRLVVIAIISIILVSSIGTIAYVRMRGSEAPRPGLRAFILANVTSAFTAEELTFDASNSTGEIAEFAWDFGYGMTAKGIVAKQAFDTSRYYNVYLTVVDKDGNRDIDSINITIYNEDASAETSGAILTGEPRRGPSRDSLGMTLRAGVTKPTVTANWTGNSVCALVSVTLWAGNEYYSDDILVTGQTLDLTKAFEGVEFEDDDYCSMDITCVRGYVTNYRLELSVDYGVDET